MEDQFKALGHEVRLRIYRAVCMRKLCVCEINEMLDMSQSAVSQHLSRLKNAGLIEGERIGQWTFYRPVSNQFRRTFGELDFEDTAQLEQQVNSITKQQLCDLRDPSGQLNN